MEEFEIPDEEIATTCLKNHYSQTNYPIFLTFQYRNLKTI